MERFSSSKGTRGLSIVLVHMRLLLIGLFEANARDVVHAELLQECNLIYLWAARQQCIQEV
jgi:hypothetical protein